jgi:hypothetical protein
LGGLDNVEAQGVGENRFTSLGHVADCTSEFEPPDHAMESTART